MSTTNIAPINRAKKGQIWVISQVHSYSTTDSKSTVYTTFELARVVKTDREGRIKVVTTFSGTIHTKWQQALAIPNHQEAAERILTTNPCVYETIEAVKKHLTEAKANG